MHCVMLSSLPGLPQLEARSTPSSWGGSPGPSREGEVVTPAEERVLVPPPARALVGVPRWVWPRALQCLHTWSQLLCLGCCLTGVRERNPPPPHHATQRPAPHTGQAGKSREGTKAWLPSLAFLPEEKVFPQASNWTVVKRNSSSQK